MSLSIDLPEPSVAVLPAAVDVIVETPDYSLLTLKVCCSCFLSEEFCHSQRKTFILIPVNLPSSPSGPLEFQIVKTATSIIAPTVRGK